MTFTIHPPEQCRCGHWIGEHDLNKRGARSACSTWDLRGRCACRMFQPTESATPRYGV